MKTYLAINTSLAHSSRKKATSRIVFQNIVFKGGLYSRKRHREKKSGIVNEIYFEKNTVE
jgi:hypothetical protein